MSNMLKKSVNILNGLNARYKIILPDGTVIQKGEFDKPKRRKPQVVRGLLSRHYLPYLKKIKLGQLIEIPYAKFNGDVLQRSVSAYARYIYGKGRIMTSKNDKRKVVEILRA